eukprot:CAMPEP_0184483308 /NCGR_PEP_ID=MMETSP0113_2-20130426/4953_1 /TAXON_ID=91329 /ORGANISM="Norrisiella sphaerica, Strain BC52" /LENGTH=241 /DNA_ID=CAMNT_0026863621 /DNA_START=8 /DNA_END=733 /DNA_ORIENTATION=+
MEETIEELRKELKTKRVGMDDPLVDRDGFPRAELDVHGIRILRNKIIRKTNDHQAIMGKLEEYMFKYHELLKKEGEARSNQKKKIAQNVVKDRVIELHKKLLEENPSMTKAEALQKALDTVKREAEAKTKKLGTENGSKDKKLEDPLEQFKAMDSFLLVAKVWPGSPAERSGLRLEDTVVKFGSVNKANQNSDSLKQIVMHSEDKPIEVVIRRKGELVRLVLTPRKWSGQGLLGCYLKPIH